MKSINYQNESIRLQLQFDPFSLAPVDEEWLKTSHTPPKKLNEKKRRRIREEQSKGQYTDQEWLEVKAKYGRCLRCQSKEKRLVADHVHPLYRGGGNDIENIQPLCWDCNREKGLQIIDYR